MSAYQTLLPIAMMGTDRRSEVAVELPGEAGDTLSSVLAEEAEPTKRAMTATAVLAAAAQAARRGRKAAAPMPAGASVDTLPEATPAALLQEAFSAGTSRLQLRACLAVKAMGQRLPALVLPAALDAASRSRELRDVALQVIGNRGRWIAQFNESWKFAAGTTEHTETVWTEGSLDERRLFLESERGRDPATARARLAASLAELPARERADLIRCLLVGLGPDDEAFLQERLEDRSKEVRQLAAGLLAALPGSDFARRAAARLDGLLQHERAMVRKVWVLDAPEHFDDAWKADGIERDRTQSETLGDRAWWLMQLVRAAPLGWWQERLQMSPAELLRWARDGQWAEAVLRAWRQALALSPQPDWCEAFLDDWPEKQLREDPTQVLALLARPRREKYWLRQLDGGWLGRRESLVMVIIKVLAGTPLGDGLSPALSARLTTALVEEVQSEAGCRDWVLNERLPELAVALSLEAAAKLVDTPLHEAAPPLLQEAQAKVRRVVELRRLLDF